MRWVVLDSGKLMPIDPEPHAQGNVLLTSARGDAKVLTADEMEFYLQQHPDTKRYRSHYATCPNAKQHRKG